MDFIGFNDALKVNKNKGFVNHENDKKIDDGFIKIRGYLSAILFPRFPQILGKTAEYGITKWEVAEIISGADSLVFDNNHQITVKGNFYEELSFGKLYTVFGKYENDEWLSFNNSKGEWWIAYHGVTSFEERIISDGIRKIRYDSKDRPRFV